MTPFPAWIASPWGSAAVIMILACAVCWCLMTRLRRR
jgi:hypothetical protein